MMSLQQRALYLLLFALIMLLVLMLVVQATMQVPSCQLRLMAMLVEAHTVS